MATPNTNPITIPILIDAINAQTNMDVLAEHIKQAAIETGISTKAIQKSLINAFTVIDDKGTAHIASNIRKLINDATVLANKLIDIETRGKKINLKVPVQIVAERDVASSDALYTAKKSQEVEANAFAERNLLNYAKELDEVNKLSAGIKKQEEAERKVTAALQERGKQRAAIDQVKAQENLYVAQKRVREETKKIAIAQTELNARLKNGTATIKEYATALKSHSTALNGQLSPKTMGKMRSISGGMVTRQTVEQVKRAMAEIQSITKLSTDKVRAIMHEMFPNIDTKNLDIAERKLQGFAARSMQYIQNFINTAIGTLTAMAIFNLVNIIQQNIVKAVQSFKDLEIAMYNLKNAEKTMSFEGINVSMEELEGVIDRIHKKFGGMFSNVELRDATADIAIAVKDLGFGANEIEKMLTAIAVVKLRTPSETMKNVTAHTITALLSGRTQSLQAMGIAANEATVYQKALDMQLIKSGDVLTTNIKALAILQIMYDSTAKETETVSKYTNTLSGASQKAGAAWTDFLTNMGRILAPDIIMGLNVISTWLVDINTWLIKNRKEWGRWAGAIAAAMVFLSFDLSKGGFKGAIQGAYDAMQIAKGLSEEMDKFENTPTIFGKNGEIDLSSINAQKEIEDLVKDLDKLDQKAAKVNQKFKEEWANDLGVGVFGDLAYLSLAQLDDLGREVQDHLTDMKRMWEDYQNSISDTVRNFTSKRANAERKYRDNEKNAEARFQEQMQQLREKFLFSLEDALHERDARQILRIIKQYEMDKTAATNEHNLARTERAKQHADEMDDLRQQEQDRLRQLAEEYELKRQRAEEDYQTKKQRAADEFKAEMEDLKAQQAARIDEFSTALISELDLKVGAAEALKIALNDYYGENGYFDALYTYSAESMVARAQQALAQVQAIAAQYRGVMASMGRVGTVIPGGGRGWGGRDLGGQAVGGTYFANHPTKATFGERGPELAMFVPLTGARSSMGKISGDSVMTGRGGGKMEILFTLSPDLEARIISNTMDRTAEVILRTGRSK